MKRKLLIYAFLILLAAGLAWYGLLYWRSRPPKPDVANAVFGSQQTLTSFLNASDITAERLHYQPESLQNPWRLAGYDRDASIPLNAEQRRTIQQVLAQESTYGWGFAKACAPDYGVLLTARSGQSTVRVALCFECYTLGVYDSADDAAKPINRENDFGSSGGRALVGLVKELFPNDPAIKKLK